MRWCFSLLLFLSVCATPTFIVIAAAVAAAFDLLPSPFVHPRQCGRPDVSRSAICDPHLYLPPHEKDILEGSLNSLAHLGQGAVAVVDKLFIADHNETVASATEAVAKATYTAWGVGRGADDKGFLVFLSLGDRTVYISIGAGLERRVGQDDLTSIISNMKVKLRSGEYGQAILVAVLEIKLLLSLSEDDPAQVWGAGGMAVVGEGKGKKPPPPQLEVSPSSGFFPPDLFGKRPPPSPPKSQEDTNRLRRREVSVSDASRSDYAKMGTGGAQRAPSGGAAAAGSGSWMLLPVAMLAGRGFYLQAEGQHALRDVVADSRVFSLAADDVIAERLPTRCPHCLSTLALQNGSDAATAADNSRGSGGSAVPPSWWVSVVDAGVGRVRSTAGWKRSSRDPGTLSCGHVLCATCIDAFSHRKSVLTKVQQWIFPDATESARVGEEAEGGARGRRARNKRKMQAMTTSSSSCKNCPVCAATLSDWASTLNKVHADAQQVESLRASATTLDGPTVTRVEALLARINRHKEVSYATWRLRRKYGIVAAIDGSFIYVHDGDDGGAGGGYGPYNRWRQQRGSGPGVHFSFGGTGSGVGSGSSSVSSSGSSSGSSGGAGRADVYDPQEVRTSSAARPEAPAGTEKSSLAQRVITSMHRTGLAEAAGSSASDRHTFRASGRSGATTAPAPFTGNSGRSGGPNGAGDSW